MRFFNLERERVSKSGSGQGPTQPSVASPLSHAGNQAVQRMLREEREADRTASEADLRVSGGPLGPASDHPLSNAERDFWKPRLGASFEVVRLHTGPDAEQSAAELKARAYTFGADIVFGRGEYRPDSADGRRLLAHELAHVVQQANSGTPRVQRQPLDQTCSADDQVCEPIPDNPLANYPYLAVALDRDSLQMLQDAAYRREHLRRGLPYDGPQGLFFAQGHLKDFLAPGIAYVSREELLGRFIPAMLTAAREHSDIEPFVAEIARNEATRQMLEPIGNPILNIEMPDPDGLEDTPTVLRFNADFKQLQDDHGALALASLDPLSARGSYLWTLIALNDAHDLAKIAGLNAKMEWLLEHYGDRLNDMAADPADYTQDEVYALAHEVMPDLLNEANNMSTNLMPGNRDQAELIAKISTNVQTLSTRASQAMDAMNRFRTDNMPDQTAGEIYEENADAIRKAASEDWDEGGWSYFGWFGNKIGLGANKLLHGIGNIGSGFYMDTHAARAKAYRMGHVSYNDYTGFHPSDIVKGAIGDLAIALPFFGKTIGAGASALLGLEEGTVASAYVEGTAAGFSSGVFAAATTDATSFLASNLSLSESERRFQAAQIGGPLSWVESGAWGGVMGGPGGALSKLMPKPVRASQTASIESDLGGASEPAPLASTTEQSAPLELSAADTTVQHGRLTLRYQADGTIVTTVEGQPDIALVIRNGEPAVYLRNAAGELTLREAPPGPPGGQSTGSGGPSGHSGATAQGLGEGFEYWFHPETPAPEVTLAKTGGNASPPIGPVVKAGPVNSPAAEALAFEEAPFASPSDWDVLNLPDQAEASALSEPGASPTSTRYVWEPPPLAAPRPPLDAARTVRLQWLQQRLQVHIDQAIERYRTEGLTTRQEAALLNRPQMQSAFRGSRIDQFAKDSIMQDPELAELITAPDFFAEPDILDSILPDWFDVTTRRQWAQHLITYGQRYSAAGHLLPTN